MFHPAEGGNLLARIQVIAVEGIGYEMEFERSAVYVQ
jgi:hypothetical protein